MNNFNKKNSKKNSKKSNLNKKDKIKKIKNDNTNNSNNINNNDNENNNNNNNKINNSIDIKCKYCENKYKIIKKGIKGKYNKQIYYCKNCKKYFSIGKDNRIRRDEKLKELALLLYSHNSSLRSIQSVIEKFYNTKISFCVITNWIKTMTKLLKIDIDSNNKTNNNSSSSNNKNSNNKNDKNINNNSNQNNKERSKRKNKIDILEMDELWSYYYDLKKKEEKESKYGLLLIGTEIKLLHIK